MSEDLKTRKDNSLLMTSFFGGSKNDTCIQITNPNTQQYIQMTKNEAKTLSMDLEDFVNDDLEEEKIICEDHRETNQQEIRYKMALETIQCSLNELNGGAITAKSIADKALKGE